MSYSKPTASTKAARAYLASLVAQLDDAVILESLDGTVLSWSAGAENLFGYSASEMVGYPSAALCGPDKVPELAALQAELLRGRAITRFETKRVRSNRKLH